MDARTLATVQAGGRLAIGAAMLAAPARTGALWVGRDGRRPGTTVVTRGFGARDVGLGAGALMSLRRGHGARPWLAAAALADTADLLATLREREALPSLAVAGIGALAAAGVALALRALPELD
jgi:hypothetical protein